jgi:hypothetical protein
MYVEVIDLMQFPRETALWVGTKTHNDNTNVQVLARQQYPHYKMYFFSAMTQNKYPVDAV